MDNQILPLNLPDWFAAALSSHSRRKKSVLRWFVNALQNHNSDECLEWPFSTHPFGYGCMNVSGFTYHAHRLSYILAFGQPPADKPDVLHKCDNPKCFNPRHLFPGNDKINAGDMAAKGRSTRGELCWAAKLTAPQVREIRELRANGMLQKDIAHRFGVARALVSMIEHRRRWKHI